MSKNTGFYIETVPKVLLINDNKVITAFRDSAVYEDDDGFHTERQMMVDGKNFYMLLSQNSPSCSITLAVLYLKIFHCNH